MPIHCYAAQAAKKPLGPFSYEPKPLGPWEIRVKISHCGICHSDIHLIDNDWKASSYPLVPGHEIVGTVNAAGSNVTQLKIGDRVGVGWQEGSCMECEWCARGEENLCPSSRAVCMNHYGGFGEEVQVDSRFAFKIPDVLESENAAPLLCGGATVYSPLRHYGVTTATKVGIIGIGGLGHLAIQFAKAFGCQVTAFSTTLEKETEAKKFGAHKFVLSKDSSQMKRAVRSLDFIVSTVCANVNWTSFMNVLRPNGKLCIVGVPPGNIQVSPHVLIGGQKSIAGSVIGSRAAIQEMLECAALHNIKAKTELMSLSEVNQACDKVRQGKARYRVVLKI